MPFDPTLPVENTVADAAQMRAQFNGLHSLITSIPAGPQGIPGTNGSDGATGPQGPPFANAVIDGVTTLSAGEAATVSVSFDGTNVHFQYGIPRGADGAAGSSGTDGAPGPQGPPFASAVVDSTTTLDPGNPASVSVSFDGASVHFAFGIPRGADGAPGANGMPGEVTNSQLNTAIAGTALNPSAIANLGLPISDPPTQSELQQVVAKLDELITALRRV